MNRIFILALAIATTVSSWAQGAFTIRRPFDGASVRETVGIRIPKNSVPDGGYIGIYVNGKFVEATLPEIDGEDYVYKWNTQAKDPTSGAAKWSDGPAKVEAVLFVDNNGKSQIVNRTSVNIKLDNTSSIKVPTDGIKLRYKFTPGVERVYSFNVIQDVSTISQAQAQLGGRAPKTTTDEAKVRILYATDNAYSGKAGKEGLMRIQMLPDKDKATATIVPPGQTSERIITSDLMAPFFMRITDVGREVFSSIPIYFGLDGRNGAGADLSFYPILPLPILPTKPVKPGDAWQSSQLFGAVDFATAFETEKITVAVPARGELEGVTWYKGMPCAIIHTVISLGPNDLKNVKNLNQVKGQASNVKLEGRTWFAIDRGAVARMEVEISQESLVETTAASAPNRGGGGDDPSGGGDDMGGGGGDDLMQTGGGIGKPRGGWTLPPTGGFEFRPGFDAEGNFSFYQGRKGGLQGGGASTPGQPGQNSGRGTGRGGGGQFGRGGGNRGAGGGKQKMVMRFRVFYVAELEK